MIKHYKNKTHRYARIHAFYAEGNNLNEEHMSDVIMNDGRFMQRKLKESQLAID